MVIKIKTVWFYVLFLSLTGVFGCGDKQEKASTPYKAMVIVYTGVDTSTGKPKYAVQEKEFKFLTDLDSLDGTYLKIERGGELKIKEVSGSIVRAESFTGSESPKLRYKLENGVVIPKDYSTMAMLSAYYQYDVIFGRMNDVLGIDPDEYVKDIPAKKFVVLFEPAITLVTSDVSGSISKKLNAAFVPGQKQFVLFQRSPLERIPLAGNLQVIAHEFGHSVFEYTFEKDKYDEDSRISKEFSISGLNEGWADFVNYGFTGCDNVLSGSIDIESMYKEREFTKTGFTFDSLEPDETAGSTTATSLTKTYDKCEGSFYCIGTIFARSLYEIRKDLGSAVTDRDFYSNIVAALKKLESTMNSLSSDIYPKERSDLKEHKRDFEKDFFTYDGKVTGAFLDSLIRNLPAAWKNSLCTTFKNNFDYKGFPTAVRNDVCS